MSIPRFNAEASLYKTNNHYRLAAGSFLSDGKTSVVPQDCGIGKGFLCGLALPVASVICAEACLSADFNGCLGCVAGAIAVLGIGGCADCIPADAIRKLLGGGGGGGGGGNNPPLCCPQGKSCQCGGTCVPGMGCVDGECLGPGQSCQ
jgi:hypothetical protein